MNRKFPTINGLTPYDNVADLSPRACFQVLGERKYGGDGVGAQLYRGSFHGRDDALAYAQALYTATLPDFYTGYEWIQVVDVMTGEVWQRDEDHIGWYKTMSADGEE